MPIEVPISWKSPPSHSDFECAKSSEVRIKKHYLSGPFSFPSRLLYHVVGAVWVPLHDIGTVKFYTVLLICTLTHWYLSKEEGWGFVRDWLESAWHQWMTSFSSVRHFIIHYLMEIPLGFWDTTGWYSEPVKPLAVTSPPFTKILESNRQQLKECPASNSYYSYTRLVIFGSVVCLYIKHLLLHELASIYKVFYFFLQERTFIVFFIEILILFLLLLFFFGKS
jgi:hypothetical protein